MPLFPVQDTVSIKVSKQKQVLGGGHCCSPTFSMVFMGLDMQIKQLEPQDRWRYREPIMYIDSCHTRTMDSGNVTVHRELRLSSSAKFLPSNPIMIYTFTGSWCFAWYGSIERDC